MQDYDELSAEWKKVWSTLPASERARFLNRRYAATMMLW